MDVFLPRRLIIVKEEIANIHNLKNNKTYEPYSDDDLQILIRRITGTSKRNLKTLIYTLTKREALLVIGYLPSNIFHVKMNNVLQVYKERTDLEGARILFSEWQNAYSNQELNDFLCKEDNIVEAFSAVLSENHCPVNTFKEMLESESIPVWYGKYCVEMGENYGEEIGERIKYLGIKEASQLYKDIIYLFYTYCERIDYIRAGVYVLLKEAEQYVHDDKAIKQFLLNFLQKLSLSDLSSFNPLAELLERLTGSNETEKQKRFFYQYPENVWDKYKEWLNRAHIFKYFGDDERSRFWSNYHFESVVHIKHSNSVVLKTENYYIVEFLGRATGPMYSYSNSVYETTIRYWMPNNSNSTLRSILYENRDKAHKRLVHNTNWQSDFDWYLRSNNITYRI